jgi:hypothetical protein
MADAPACGATTVFWPDDEACDAVCALPSGHQPAQVHEDDALGAWNENDMPTTHPEPAAPVEEED